MQSSESLINYLCQRYQPFYQCYLLVRSCMHHKMFSHWVIPLPSWRSFFSGALFAYSPAPFSYRLPMGKNAEPQKEWHSNDPGPLITRRNWRNFNPSGKVNPSLENGYPARGPGARFSKVPKLFGRISGDIFLFVSSKRRRLEARNFAVILIFIPFTTYEKTSFTE